MMCVARLTSESVTDAAQQHGGKRSGRGAAHRRIGRAADEDLSHGSVREGLDRPDEQPARARDATGDRRPARARSRRLGDRARLRPDARAVRALRDRAHADRPPPRRRHRRPRRAGSRERSFELARWARGTALRPRARARLERHHGRRDAAADPLRDDVRLRVGDRPAQRQLPPRAGRRRPRRDPARAPLSLRRDAARSARIRGSRRSTTWPTSSPTRRSSPSSASTPRAPIAVSARRRRSRSITASRTTCSRRCSIGCAASQTVVLPRTPEQRAELTTRRRVHRPRARDRLAVADRLRGPRRLGRRDDEPRGGRARNARVHRVRGPPRRGRRAPDRRGSAAETAAAPTRSSWSSAHANAPARIRRDPALLTDLLIA